MVRGKDGETAFHELSPFGGPTVAKIESCIPGLSAEELLSIVASAELRSEHPLGKAIVAHYREKNGGLLSEPDNFQLIPGRGVSAGIEGRRIYAGNEELLSDVGIRLPEQLIRAADEAKNDGCTVIYVAAGDRAAGFVALSDTLRPDVAETVGAIHAAGVETVLLTGDAHQAARRIAQAVGITELQSNCLPEDKMAAIFDLNDDGRPVCMVGDGINDAPALKAARVGIAMGGVGSDIAIDAADIVLVGDEIKEIPHLLQLSRKTMRTINVNLAASLILNFIATALAIAGILNPISGALVHNVGSVAVIVNSSLLLKWRENSRVDQQAARKVAKPDHSRIERAEA